MHGLDIEGEDVPPLEEGEDGAPRDGVGTSGAACEGPSSTAEVEGEEDNTAHPS